MFTKQTTVQYPTYKLPMFRVETWLLCCLVFPASLAPVLATGNNGNETEIEECQKDEECLTERVGRRIRTQRQKPTRFSIRGLFRTGGSVSRGNTATFATLSPDAAIHLRC